MVLKSFTGGIARVLKSPALILWIYFAGALIALPVSLAVKNILHESFGMSLVNENMRAGFDLSWFGEFSAGSSGLASTFGPWVTGILPVLSNLESLLDGKILRGGTLLLAGGAFLLLWTFFAGGILDRYANPGAPRLRVRFFAHCGEYFFPFLRLLAISLLIYWAVFRFVANPLHTWVENSARDVTTERTIIFYTAAVYALTALLLAFCTVALDYARIAIVVEHRRSALFTFFRGLRFVFSNPARTCGLWLLLAAMGLALFGAYGYAAPGPGQATWRAVLGAFFLGQAFILCRIVLKLWFLASQTLLFQSAQSAAAPAQAMPGPTVLQG